MLSGTEVAEILTHLLISALAALCFQTAPGAGAGAGALAVSLAKPLPPEELGDVLIARREYREGLKQYLQCDQTSAVIANKVGVAYQQLLDFRSAIKQYRRATKLDAGYAVAINNLGTVYHSQKNFRRAIQLYRRALRLAPDDATVYSNLGSAYFSIRHFKDAMAVYQKALDLDPNILESRPVGDVSRSERDVTRRDLIVKTCRAFCDTESQGTLLFFQDRERSHY